MHAWKNICRSVFTIRLPDPTASPHGINRQPHHSPNFRLAFSRYCLVFFLHSSSVRSRRLLRSSCRDAFVGVIIQGLLHSVSDVKPIPPCDNVLITESFSSSQSSLYESRDFLPLVEILISDISKCFSFVHKHQLNTLLGAIPSLDIPLPNLCSL